MIVTIQNAQVKLEVDTLGIQMMTLTDAEGIQYLWEGDPKCIDQLGTDSAL